ncbi:hypothetical protein [Sphingomonas sp. CFBP9021]|uniref:hypothetical protein n=1 Tax=Sphingomonas sp. CFBP9021 TaxID=3096534 RepID=UPI002A6B0196|nr:hypothetical protein [Sphingomonas sp. CFBP9021]MDY0967582.1 hypothetical protein [Sphingomonas sp. CFBP9021]
MSDMQQLLSAIQVGLPVELGKPQLVQDIQLVWTRKLGALRGNGVLVVTTARELTTEGGNGWTGLDGKDLDMIDAAISNAVDEVGATGMIDRFIVRANRNDRPLSDAEVDHLFD